MSVYTTIQQDELNDFLSNYSVGNLVDYQGISEGIENTNYFVDTDAGRFVLTLFETHTLEDMQYYLGLMHHLADHDVPSADPVADNQGEYLRIFKGKPAALVERLRGSSIKETTVDACSQIGAAMGMMHAAGQSYAPTKQNHRGPHWFVTTAKRLSTVLPEDDMAMLEDEIQFQSSNRNMRLPQGVVHADLFRDNTLWDGDTLSGIIDFYYACNDVLLYDLAVTVNDWCINDDYSLDATKVTAFIDAYDRYRKLEAIEHGLWPVLLRTGALRFWLSRLQDLHFPRPGEIVHQKDPDEFKAILTDRRTNHDLYRDVWLSN